MKANELRIGNLVYLSADGHEHEPDLMEWELQDYEFYENKMDYVEPIPLTKEWLLKFGFIENDIPDNYVKEIEDYGLKYLIVRKDNTVICTNEPCMVISLMQIRKTDYVHQLQNLYFALTCKDLNI